MIEIFDKSKCCGCNACGDICQTKAISFEVDIEGFWYPIVDENLCIDCGLCNTICPNLHSEELKRNNIEKPVTIAAINKNLTVRWDSTSGGAFSAFAQSMYEKGGYIGGAIFNDQFIVNNFISNNPEDLKALRSSKYLQSNAEGLYVTVCDLLKKGEKVLICGTPCQMAGLRKFLGKEYENLIILDFICRGVNSPKVFRKYLDALEKKYNSKIVYIKEKNKELGWRSLTRKIVFENGEKYYGVSMKDSFRRGYHTNVFCRPSCYDCQFKGFPRIADITLGDYWGIEKVDVNLDNNIGTSMILLNTDKGKRYFEENQSKFEYKYTPFESILGGNIALQKSIEPPKISREEFFEELNKNSFEDVALKYFPVKQNHSTKKQKIKRTLSRFKYLYGVYGKHPKAYYNFFWLNFRRTNTISNFEASHVIYTKPGVVFDIHPTAKINIYAPIIFGNDPVKGVKMPTCLKMTANTSFTINDGPITRYGQAPYNLRYGAYIEIVNGGKLTIGQGGCNVGLTIMCAKEVTIGNGVRIGRNVSIRDWNGPHVIVNDTYVNHAPVHIGDHVWLTTGSTIMPGVTVGQGSVVATNAVVTKDVPPYCLVAGVPAKVVKENIEWY